MSSSVALGYPLYANGMAWSSLLSRQYAGGVAVWDTNASATAVNPRGGVFLGPANPLAVAPLATPGMSVLVNAGYCAVPHPTQGHGVYLFGLTAQATLTVAANVTGSARIDIVIARVYDLSSSSSYCDVEIISGTAGSGQPATPTMSILLGTVTVAPSATAIMAGNITDQRVFTVAPGGVLPTSAAAAPPLAVGQVVLNTATGGLQTVAPPVTSTKSFTTSTSWISSFTGLVWASGVGGDGAGGGGYQDQNGNNTTSGGGGGGGGEWAGDWIHVTIGHSYPVTIGQGGYRGSGGTNSSGTPAYGTAGSDGTATTFTGDTQTLTANGGHGGQGAGQEFPAQGGTGGTGSTNAQHQPGGSGGSGAVSSSAAGGGGGGSGSPGAPGGAGGNASGNRPGPGGVTGPGGGAGGAGGDSSSNGSTGTSPGGAGGGGGADEDTYWQAGGNGVNGGLTLTWTIQPAALTAVRTTISGEPATPSQYLALINTDTSTGENAGAGSAYGWGIGYGATSSGYSVGYYWNSELGQEWYGPHYGTPADGTVAPQIQISFTADGRTDYQIDARWGLAVPVAAVDGSAPTIPYGRCRIIVYLDTQVLDQVFLNCAMKSGVLYPGDAGSFTVYTTSQNGTTPAAGPHTVILAVETTNTASGQYSGAHVGDLASVGTSAGPFSGALPAPYLAALVAEQSYLRVAGISASGL